MRAEAVAVRLVVAWAVGRAVALQVETLGASMEVDTEVVAWAAVPWAALQAAGARWVAKEADGRHDSSRCNRS